MAQEIKKLQFSDKALQISDKKLLVLKILPFIYMFKIKCVFFQNFCTFKGKFFHKLKVRVYPSPCYLLRHWYRLVRI